MEDLTRQVSMEEDISLKTLRIEYNICVKDQTKLQPYFQFFENNSPENPIHCIKIQGS